MQRFALTLAQGARGSGKSTLLDRAAHERAALGVSSYVYRARRAFQPGRQRACLLQGWPGVIRLPGIFWLATRLCEARARSQVGPTWQASRGGFWCGALEAKLTASEDDWEAR